ncbi:MAG: ribonuclease R [Bacteroidales bacterium]|nr:ribonuclease R [Candidatus Cacconaster merdequi]
MTTKKTKGAKKDINRHSKALKSISGIRIKDKGARRSKSTEEVEGVLSLTRDGFGFVKVDGREEDIYIPWRRTSGGLNGDFVKVAVSKKKSRMKDHSAEGEVIRVIERSAKPHIGIIHTRGRQVWAIVESKNMPYDIQIPVDSEDGLLPEIGGIRAEKGMKVAVLVTDWPKNSAEPVGKIVDVLGHPGDNDTEMHAILAEYQLPYRFESEVENAANGISEKITEKDLAERRDFRSVTTFTIDPADAKDFDDALSYRQLENGNVEVGVHIADVTHYVQPESVVDKEAFLRGTSVYLVDRTIPMLPEMLSNKLCSLRPKEEKLCFSAVFELDAKAKVKNQWFGHTVIKSDYRFNYDEAQDIIENQHGPLCKEILALHSLAQILRKERFEKGAISFERPEMKVIVDKNGKPLDVVQKESKEANWLIEEYMLLANRCVAEYVTRKCKAKEPTFVYRIHENPNEEKLSSLRSFAKNFGYTLGDTADPKKAARSLNDLMKAAKDSPAENALQLLALRSMARARYSTDNVGHYGLAFPFYCHFTSPIRRYPDMMVHRLLDIYLAGGKSQDKMQYEEYCKHSSEREQIATEAERASIKYKMVEFMEDKIGQEFEGSISGLTEWGIYVEIEPTHIEGMVSLRDIREDYLQFDEEKYETRGKASGRVFRLGDKVRIKVLRANLEQKILDYELIWE